MFSRKKTNAASRFAIDPGAFRTRFCSATKGLLLDQPSIAALDMDHPAGGSKAVSTFGDQAEQVMIQGLDGLRSIQPVQSDQHNDLGLSAKMLSHFLNQATRSGIIAKSPKVLLMLPHDCSTSKRAQLQLACKQAGARSIEIQNAALAAFYSTELEQSQPCIMIDFGATASRMFAIADSEVVYHQNLPFGGDTLDQAIAAGLLERFSLYVSDKSAQEIKHRVAAATPQSFVQCTRNSCQVDCLAVKTNITTRFRVGSETVNDILKSTLDEFANSIKSALAGIDESIQDSAYETGIRICGGGALLPRMDQLVIAATNLPVEVVKRPLNSNIRGAASTMAEAVPKIDLEYLV